MDFQDYIRQLSEQPPTDHMTKALRRKSQLGELGMITGDEALTKVGASMVDSSGSEAWRNAQMDQQRQGVLSRALESEEDRKFQGEQNRLTRALQAQIANMKATKPKSFGAKDIERISETVNETYAIGDIADAFKDDYARLSVPGGRGMANWAASKGIGTDNAEESQKWWAEWDRIYTLPVRNKMFGSALTATELAAWEKANITTDMTPAQIRANLKTITGLRAKALKKLGGNFKTMGYDEDQIDYLFSSVEMDDEAGSGDLAVGHEEDGYIFQGGDAGNPKSWKRK